MFFFFFQATAPTEIYTLSLHDALPIYQRRLGAVPLLVGADALRGPGGDLVDDVREAEMVVDLLHQRRVGDALGHDLLFGAEDMAVVLGEAARAHDAVQRPRGFVPVAGAELAVAQGQVAVALHA